MSVDARVKQYITTNIPDGRSSLSKSHQDLRALAEHCQKEISRHKEPSLQTTQVYAAQSLASVAYQINTLAGQLVDLLKLQCDQWGEMEHQISDISQQFNFYEEKRSRHLIGKFTSEKPVHLMRRVNPPPQKEAFTKYERHPINFTVWDHIGHGSPSRDSVPAAETPGKKSQPRLMSYGQDRHSQLIPQPSIIDTDIYGTSFDANRYLKKPVAHSIPIAPAIPPIDPNQDTERDLTATSELFTQGHTTDSLYDSLVHIPGERSAFETSEKPLLTATLSDMYQDPEATMFSPSPLVEPLSPLAEPLSPLSDTPLSPPPEELEPDLTLDDLDKDLYTQEDLPSPPTDLPPPPLEPIETPKPPRPANPAPARPAAPSLESQKRPSRSAPGAPPSASVPAAPEPPPLPTSSVPSRHAPPSGAVRPTRPAPPPSAAVAKLSAQDTLPPSPPFVDDPNVPAPPPDMPAPLEANPRVPPPPPNMPKDGVTRPGKSGSVLDVPASPTKKVPPKPAQRGFDPSDIINMQKSLKKKAALRSGATIDIPTQPDTPPPKTSITEQGVQSVPANFPLPSAALAPTGAPADSSASIPDPPSDIPDGWSKNPVGAAKSVPVVKKSVPPKPQPLRSAGFDPSQIPQRKLRPSQGSISSAPAEQTDTGSAPPSYIEKVETIYPYKAQKEDELNFGKGKVIYVLKKNPDGWYEGYMEGVRGLFPENYSKPIN